MAEVTEIRNRMKLEIIKWLKDDTGKMLPGYIVVEDAAGDHYGTTATFSAEAIVPTSDMTLSFVGTYTNETGSSQDIYKAWLVGSTSVYTLTNAAEAVFEFDQEDESDIDYMKLYSDSGAYLDRVAAGQAVTYTFTITLPHTDEVAGS